MSKTMRGMLMGIGFSLALILAACGPEGKETAQPNAKPDTAAQEDSSPPSEGKKTDLPNAKPYTVVLEDEKNAYESTRFIIAPEAKTRQERAETVKKAVLDLYKEKEKKSTRVHIAMDKEVAGRSLTLATAAYTPSEDIAWTIEATDQQISDAELQALKLWIQNRDAISDDNKLKKLVAKKMGIPVDKVEMPFFSKEKVNLN